MNDSVKTISDTLIYNEKLSELNSIFIPESVRFELITPGWYLLAGLIILLLIYVFINFMKKYKNNEYRRNAVKDLRNISDNIGTKANSEILEKISSLLKLTSFKSYGRDLTASLFSNAWKEFLVSKLHKKKEKGELFSLFEKQYSSDSEDITKDAIHELIEISVTWVKKHHV